MAIRNVNSNVTKREPPSNIIAHLGVGGFSRAHQFYCLHLLRTATASPSPSPSASAPNASVTKGCDWGYLGVGLKSWDAKMYEALKSQDYVYACNMRGKDSGELVVVESIVDYAPLMADPKEVEKLYDARVKIMSLTVTEKGYCLNDAGALDVDNKDVKKDIETFKDPSFRANTAIGLIAHVLSVRKARGLPPLTIMSCDNLPTNGATTKKAVLALASAVSSELAAYITSSVPFPNSMVDRITPVTTPQNISEIESRHGIKDAWPVICEPFLQWVIEDNFVNGCRPDWSSLPGVEFTKDVEHYENMKLSLLNSTHSSMSYLSILAGFDLVHEAVQDPGIEAFLRSYMSEITPTLTAVPGVDFEEYASTLITRFSNPEIADNLNRLALDGSQKFRSALGPALTSLKSSGGAVDAVCLALAGFLRYNSGVADDGSEVETVPDPMKKEMKEVALRMRGEVSEGVCAEALAMVFGDELVRGWD